jgi:ABC-type dipeptide/oligopeptide/nickel transport system permease component
MGVFAWFVGVLGGLCAVMGIITAAEVIPVLGSDFSGMFWLALAAVLLLASIALALGRSGGRRGEEYFEE